MARRKFVKIEYPELMLELSNADLGALVRLKWHMLEFYFLGVEAGPDGVDVLHLDPIPVNSRALHAITRRKKRDAQRACLEIVGKVVGFTVQMEGDTAFISWPKWWESQGLAPTRRRLERPLNAGNGNRRRNTNTSESRRESGNETPLRPALSAVSAPEEAEESKRRRRVIPTPSEVFSEEDRWLSAYALLPTDRLQIEKWVIKSRPDLAATGKLYDVFEQWATECSESGFVPNNAAAAFTSYLKDYQECE